MRRRYSAEDRCPYCGAGPQKKDGAYLLKWIKTTAACVDCIEHALATAPDRGDT